MEIQLLKHNNNKNNNYNNNRSPREIKQCQVCKQTGGALAKITLRDGSVERFCKTHFPASLMTPNMRRCKNGDFRFFFWVFGF
jgi:hypothetical protein